MFQCSNCGRQYVKYEGRCGCTSQWGTITEIPNPISSQSTRQSDFQNIEPLELSSIIPNTDVRNKTEIPEMDRVLGGGLVQGSVILLGGEPGIGLEVSEEAKDLLIELGYDPNFGARPLRRVIQDKLEDMLSEDILSGRLKSGDLAHIDVEDAEFVMRTRTEVAV